MMKYLVIIISLIYLTACTSTKKIRTKNGISEINYLEVNGIKQYVLIRGKDKRNPVLLFLHGGPGASATPLLRKFNSELEEHFTIVYWDQRAAGKSYTKKISKEEIKVSKYIQDADSIVSYLKNRFNVEKIFLIGHSWGSRLGLYAIQKNPESFMAYVGVGQELVSYEGELISYQYTVMKAKDANNLRAIKELQEIGEPQSGDYTKMYKNGFWGLVKQKDWLLKLGGERYGKTKYTDWIFSIWFSREYSFLDLIKYGRGSGFSAGSIIYDPDFNDINFFQEIPEVKVPAFFISGASDYNTPWTLVQDYCNKLKSPYKEFIKFDKSGHSPVFEEPEKFNAEILRIYERVEELGFNDKVK